MDMVSVYEGALRRTGAIIEEVRPAQLTKATPCGRWDVRGVVNHLVDGLHGWVDMIEGRRWAPDETRDMVGDDLAGAYAKAAEVAAAAFAGTGVLQRTVTLPNGTELTGERALGIALMEAVVHGWDIAKATGGDTSIDEAVAAQLVEGLKATGIPRDPGGNPFSDERTAPKGAPAGDRLVAFLGRTP